MLVCLEHVKSVLCLGASLYIDRKAWIFVIRVEFEDKVSCIAKLHNLHNFRKIDGLKLLTFGFLYKFQAWWGAMIKWGYEIAWFQEVDFCKLTKLFQTFMKQFLLFQRLMCVSGFNVIGGRSMD